jgi:hypothetical protein
MHLYTTISRDFDTGNDDPLVCLFNQVLKYMIDAQADNADEYTLDLGATAYKKLEFLYTTPSTYVANPWARKNTSNAASLIDAISREYSKRVTQLEQANNRKQDNKTIKAR